MKLASIKASRKAFSLLEVLITVAILSSAIIFLFRSFAASLSSMRFSQHITLACYLAENNLWEIETRSAAGANLPATSSKKLQNINFGWSYEISDTDIKDIKKLNLKTTWKENARKMDYSLDFLTYLAVKE